MDAKKPIGDQEAWDHHKYEERNALLRAIARIAFNIKESESPDWCQMTGASEILKKLEHFGFRKIQDNEIVIAKDELINQERQMGKEVAESILHWLLVQIHSNQCAYTVGVGVLEGMIQYEAEEFGVQVKDDTIEHFGSEVFDDTLDES